MVLCYAVPAIVSHWTHSQACVCCHVEAKQSPVSKRGPESGSELSFWAITAEAG